MTWTDIYIFSHAQFKSGNSLARCYGGGVHFSINLAKALVFPKYTSIDLIASQIGEVKFLFVMRSDNLAAHLVASFVAYSVALFVALYGDFYL